MTAVRVPVRRELLEWACARVDLDIPALTPRFPNLPAWARGDTHPTLKQLESFATATHTAVGYLLLPTPPTERLPIPDLRTVKDTRPDHPSPDLLDTIYACQRRQDWYRDHARAIRQSPLPFVGSATLYDDVETIAARMREALDFDLDARRTCPTWTEALRRFIEQADALGILVMVGGIVGGNTHRALDPDEFRGFALTDDLAPVVFVNGADTKAAQMFTLAHELAHVWLGRTALSDVDPNAPATNDVERWCNQVAAELLAPISIVRAEFRIHDDLRTNLDRIARRFKVSTLVVLRRLHEAKLLSRKDYWAAYRDELGRLQTVRRASGGNFYASQTARVGRRFATAIITSTLEGRTLFREALQLLGFSKVATFHELASRLQVG